jgi:hypothetical protein
MSNLTRSRRSEFAAALWRDRFAPARRDERFEAPDDSARRAKNAEHIAYLARMAAEKVVPPELARRAKAIWIVASITAGNELPIPAAAAFTGGPIEYHWEEGPHQLSVEIPATGPCHWFYRNKSTGEVWGEGADGLTPPRRAERYLERLVASLR